MPVGVIRRNRKSSCSVLTGSKSATGSGMRASVRGCVAVGAGTRVWVGASSDLMVHGFSMLETLQAGRWVRPETLSRYVRWHAVGEGAMARLYADSGLGMAMSPVLVGLGR